MTKVILIGSVKYPQWGEGGGGGVTYQVGYQKPGCLGIIHLLPRCWHNLVGSIVYVPTGAPILGGDSNPARDHCERDIIGNHLLTVKEVSYDSAIPD